jgi:hypothetical protein
MFFLIAVNCNQLKKTINNTATKETVMKTEEELVVVLKNANNVADAKALIENSGLTWETLVINDKTLKAALIKVPVQKKTFWLERLKTSNVFSSVVVNSEETIKKIKYIAKNTFVKIRRTHCRGICPVFDVLFFNDGKVTFNGIEHVPFKGKKDFTLTKKQFQELKNYFSKTTFNLYPISYIDRSVADLPSTIITHQNKEIKIKRWKNVPKELVLANAYLDKILKQEKLLE